MHLVSKIGGVDEFGKYLQPEQLQREHILTAQEFSEVFNANVDNSYKVLRKAVDKLMKTDLKVERNESLELWRINVCSMAKYNKKEGCITVKFTDDIMPYLAQVRKKFVLYNLKEIANFGSLYTGLGSNGTANRLKVFLLLLMALTRHVLPHLAWRRNCSSL